MKKLSWLVLLSVIAASSFSLTVKAQGRDIIDLKAVTCTELLKSSGDKRANLIIFIHGYLNGKAGNTTIDAPALASATNKVIDACINNPKQNLLAVFEANR